MTDGDLQKCLLHVIGRATVRAAEVRQIIGKGKNRIKAFNLFDGSRTIQEIARKTRIDSGNLSRAVSDWVENGIAFWVGKGTEARLLHIYPIPKKEPKSTQ